MYRYLLTHQRKNPLEHNSTNMKYKDPQRTKIPTALYADINILKRGQEEYCKTNIFTI